MSTGKPFVLALVLSAALPLPAAAQWPDVAKRPVPPLGMYCSEYFESGGICEPGEPDSPSTSGIGSIWAEFMTIDQVRDALPALPPGVAVNLEWPAADLANPERLQLVAEAAAMGIEIRPWLLLPFELGYWPNSLNAEPFAEAARGLFQLWQTLGLEPTRLMVDMEMPIFRTPGFAQASATGDVDVVAAFLREGIDRAQYARATRIFAKLVDDAHALGWKVEIGTLPQVLDDYADGDDDLRQGLNIPLNHIDWDGVTFIAYRTLAEALLGARPSPYFVYTYGVYARQVFGERAGLAIGMTEPGEITPDAPAYDDGDELRMDVEAARIAGIDGSLTSVYNLRGIAWRLPVEQWFQPPMSLPAPPPSDPLSDFAQSITLAVDAAM